MCQSWICFSPILGKCKSKYCKNAHKYYYNVLMNMRIWRYSMENIIHPIQAPRAIFFNSFVCVCGFTSYLNTLRLKTRCYQRLNWRNTNVYLWSGRRATENWVWQGTPEFSVFTPSPKKNPTSKLCTQDLRCQRKRMLSG